MTKEDLCGKLDSLYKGFPDSGFNAIPDDTIASLDSCAGAAGGLGFKNTKEAIENLSTILKACKAGEKGDESVIIRLTALDYYITKLKDGAGDDL